MTSKQTGPYIDGRSYAEPKPLDELQEFHWFAEEAERRLKARAADEEFLRRALHHHRDRAIEILRDGCMHDDASPAFSEVEAHFNAQRFEELGRRIEWAA